MFKKLAVTATLLSCAALSGQALAQAAEYGAGEQGSVLFFPFDLTGGQANLMRISNSSVDSQDVHLVRVCHGIKFVDDTCRKVDTSITLTGNETRKIDVATALPGPSNCDYGFIVAYAEDAFFSRVPESHNHLLGDMRWQVTNNGRRQAVLPAAAFKCLAGGDGTNCGAQQTLAFDGASYEQVRNNLKTIFRAGVNPTRKSILYMATIDVTAGLQNGPTGISAVHYSETEAPRSDAIEYICAARIDNSTNDLPGMNQATLGSVHGLSKLTAVDGNDPQVEHGVIGWVYEQDGSAKGSGKAMWNDDDATPVTTTFVEF